MYNASVDIGKHIGMILLLYHIVSRKFLRQSGYLSMIDFEDLLDYNCIATSKLHENSKICTVTREAEPVRLVRFWLDYFSRKVQNIFQLTKNQMYG